jgi:RNA polymerase sigma-70 factor (ECF subfamily)
MPTDGQPNEDESPSGAQDTAGWSIVIDHIYLEHRDRCLRLAIRIVRDVDLAHDVVQDVFEAISRHPVEFDSALGGARSWLLTMTHNKAVDLIRWRTRHVGLDHPMTAMEADLAVRDRSPEESAVAADDQRHLFAAIALLGEGEREVIVLAHFGGYTHGEIARRTGLPLGTVKSRTRRALQLLRVQLAAS